MHFTNEDVDRFEAQMTVALDESFVKRSLRDLSASLDVSPRIYLEFGIYWWALKEGLRRYFPSNKWYCGSFDDQRMKSQCWRGTLFRTVLAGIEYRRRRVFKNHSYQDADGQRRTYRLTDQDYQGLT